MAETFAHFVRDGADAPALTIPRCEPALGPARLAAVDGGSAADRGTRQALYERCLAHYRAVVRPHDVEVDDVGAAASHFVVACFAALRGVRPTPTALRHLEQQLVAIVRRGKAWSQAAADERRLCFEQLAVLAVLIAGLVANGKARPDLLAQAQRGARIHLKQLLGLDPDGLTIGRDGLTVARARHPA